MFFQVATLSDKYVHAVSMTGRDLAYCEFSLRKNNA
jgi:hypothetical protein